MLSTANLPYLEFASDPVSMGRFYEDLARHFLSKLPNATGDLKLKLQHEFYVVCLLNSLFGNANLQLVQLHPDFAGGLRNFERLKEQLLHGKELIG